MSEAKKVKVFVPRGASNEEPNVFISVNGVNYLLPKGKESEVPAHIAEEYYRCQAAEARAAAHKDEMSGK